MNNHLAMNICEAIMPIKDDCVNVTITTDSNKVYDNVEILDFVTKGAYFSNVLLMYTMIRLLKSMLEIYLSKY